ncbi:hypothetical protein H0H92_005227 [Tricholoma furcatifolium]|nr:hypothetical protein H0H92_005227 [Tricholoma furcatifolium]
MTEQSMLSKEIQELKIVTAYPQHSWDFQVATGLPKVGPAQLWKSSNKSSCAAHAEDRNLGKDQGQGLQHPQSTLSKVLGNINDAIENAQPFLALIPDSPFPAQSLVKGLAQVLQLGQALSDADRKLYNFALGVVHWITDIKNQVTSFGNEDFAKVTWKNLAKVR